MKNTPCEKFIQIWETSKNSQEAADRLGITRQASHMRAALFRRNGVALKKLKTRRKYDWEHLKKVLAAIKRK